MECIPRFCEFGCGTFGNLRFCLHKGIMNYLVCVMSSITFVLKQSGFKTYLAHPIEYHGQKMIHFNFFEHLKHTGTFYMDNVQVNMTNLFIERISYQRVRWGNYVPDRGSDVLKVIQLVGRIAEAYVFSNCCPIIFGYPFDNMVLYKYIILCV